MRMCLFDILYLARFIIILQILYFKGAVCWYYLQAFTYNVTASFVAKCDEVLWSCTSKWQHVEVI